MFGTGARRVWRVVASTLVPLATVVLLAVVATGAYRLGYLNETICDGPCGAAFVDPPAGVEPISAGRVAAPIGSNGPADGAKIKSAVAPALQDAALGPRVGFTAIDLATGATLWSTKEAALIPASTNKIFTTFAALRSMDPQHRFATTVRRTGPKEIVIVGGGDPYLSSKASKRGDYPKVASIQALAKKSARSLRATKMSSVRLRYDATMFSGPADNPQWERSYVSENIVTPISALWVDQGGKGGVRADEPAASAARDFAAALKKEGIAVDGDIVAGKASADAPVIATVWGPTVAQIVELINDRSDNEAAEVLFRQVAIKSGRDGSFKDGAVAVKTILSEAGIDMSDTQIFDGSGLSRHDRTTTTTLARTLYIAAQDQRTKTLLTELPIAGFSGTLRDRFSSTKTMVALGLVRAKTGTLSGVQGLAGTVTDAQGRGIVFAALGNDAPRIGPYAGRTAIERIASVISECSCG